MMGRLSPDPSALTFADPTNPQSLNLYSYALNSPLINTDPTGLDCVYDNGDGTVSTGTGFLSPDPSQLYYADPTNPQSLNLYGYVMNNPLTVVDPTGLALQLNCSPSSPDSSSTGTDDAGNTVVTVTGGTQNCNVYDDGQGNYNGFLSPPSQPRAGSSPGFSFPPLPPINPCDNSTLTAAGVSAKKQVATAQGFIAAGQVGASTTPYANPVLSFFGGMYGYYEAVHTGGPNDIKDLPGHSRQNPTDVNAGNISFGITCPYGTGFCQFAAGFAQSVIGRAPDFSATLATGYDTPADNAGIQIGQAMRAAGCHE